MVVICVWNLNSLKTKTKTKTTVALYCIFQKYSNVATVNTTLAK